MGEEVGEVEEFVGGDLQDGGGGGGEGVEGGDGVVG